MKIYHIIIALAIFAALATVTVILFLTPSPKKYSIDLDGDEFAYKGVRSGYKEGETVTLYYDLIATDTDYTFYLDGEPLKCGYDEKKGFVISFQMPAHNVRLTCESRNTMGYIPE